MAFPSKMQNNAFWQFNHEYQYFIEEIPIGQVTLLNDLGVDVSSNLRFNEHVMASVTEANRVLDRDADAVGVSTASINRVRVRLITHVKKNFKASM